MGIRREYGWEMRDINIPAYPPRPKMIDPRIDRLIKHADSRWYSFERGESEEKNMLIPPPPPKHYKGWEEVKCITSCPVEPPFDHRIADGEISKTHGYTETNIEILKHLSRRVEYTSKVLQMINSTTEGYPGPFIIEQAARAISSAKMEKILTDALSAQLKEDLEKIKVIDQYVNTEPEPTENPEVQPDNGSDTEFYNGTDQSQQPDTNTDTPTTNP